MRFKAISWNKAGRNLAAIASLLFCLAATARLAAASANTEALRHGDEYVKAGKLNLARRAYEQAIAAGADLSKDYARAHNLGVCYLQSTPRDLRRARKWLELALKAKPGADDTRLLLAQALAWSGKPEAALQQYRVLAQAHPDNSDYAVGEAFALFSADKKNDAFALLQTYVDAHAADINVRLEYARLLAYSRTFRPAMEQYQIVLNADPNNLSALVGIAKLTSWENDLPRALAMFNQILVAHPNLYDAQVGKAFTLFWMGKDEEARSLFEMAARRNASDREVARALKLLGPRTQQQAHMVPAPAPSPQTTSPAIAELAVGVAPEPVASAGPRSPAAPTPVVQPAPQLPPAPPGLQQQAETATARGNYPEAIRDYRELLNQNPQNQELMMRLARVLSWSKDYAASIAEYDAILHLSPDNLQAHIERARVLSWSRNFSLSIAEYRRVLQQMQAGPAAAQNTVSAAEIKLELARVLSWDGRYAESLALLNQLLPSGQKPQVKDEPVLLEKARVLAYQHQYEQAVRTYDQVLALTPHDYEARVGKAQAIYWSGHLRQAERQLHAVLAEQPSNANASFILAAVEHGRGNDGEALRLLQGAPADNETRQLRDSIVLNQRPVLRFRFGFEDDREVDSSGPRSTIKPLHYTTAFAFNVTSGVRLEVENTVTHVLTSNRVLSQFGSDAIASSTTGRISFRIAPWLRMTAGAGQATTGRGSFAGITAAREQHFIYEVHPVVSGGGFRLDLTATRGIFPYTPLAVHSNVVQTRESVAPSYESRRHLRVGVEYWYAQYDLRAPDPLRPAFSTAANGGSAFLTPILHQTERLTIEAGMRYDSFAFQHSAVSIDDPVTGIGSAGFFTPRLYQRYAGTGNIALTMQKHVSLDLHGTFGPQRIFGFPELAQPPAEWGTTGSAGSQLTFSFGRWQPYFAYDYFSTNTPAGPALLQGTYRSHLFVTGMALRF